MEKIESSLTTTRSSGKELRETGVLCHHHYHHHHHLGVSLPLLDIDIAAKKTKEGAFSGPIQCKYFLTQGIR